MSEHLAHYGVKGQKWGIRRFQNPDGTLTEEGKKRYGKDIADKYEQIRKTRGSQVANLYLKNADDNVEIKNASNTALRVGAAVNAIGTGTALSWQMGTASGLAAAIKNRDPIGIIMSSAGLLTSSAIVQRCATLGAKELKELLTR